METPNRSLEPQRQLYITNSKGGESHETVKLPTRRTQVLMSEPLISRADGGDLIGWTSIYQMQVRPIPKEG